MRDSSAQAAPQIEVEKSASAPAFFNSRPEHPKGKHVERQMPQSGVNEHVGERRPPAGRKISDRKSERAKNLIRPDEGQLQKIDADIRRHQPLYGWCHSGSLWRIE